RSPNIAWCAAVASETLLPTIGLTIAQPGPVGATVDVDAADKFDRDGGERDAGQAQGRNTQAAIEEPRVEQAVERESEDQEISVRRGVAGGLQHGVDDADHHEEDRAVEDDIHEGKR